MASLTATVELAHRDIDDYGSGAFRAPRGVRENGKKRVHNGIDYVAPPGTQVNSPADGKVTKLGFSYANGMGAFNDPDFQYQYVEIKDSEGAYHRVHYVEPSVRVGDRVAGGKDRIGTLQNISARYTRPGKKMLNHAHRTKKVNGRYINPEE